MASAATSAVFFLGTRAHYQTLQPPDSARYDAENGNEPAECGWVHCARSERSGSDLLLLEYHCEETTPAASGVKHRFRGKRAADCTNERIITEDGDPVGFHSINYRDSIKSKESVASGRCASLRALLSSLRSRRKRKLSVERGQCAGATLVPALPAACTYRDSCRCLDCQSRYFECDESDSDCSVSSDNYNHCDDYDDYDEEVGGAGGPPPASPPARTSAARRRTSYDDDEEVFIDAPLDNGSAELLIEGDAECTAKGMSVSSDASDESPLELEMAAGTPVVLDFLLNHPITCCLQ